VAIDSAPDCNDLEGGAVTSDQRGATRPWGASCDVGAYEAGAPAPPVFTPTPLPIGFPCTSDARCISGFCVDGVCCRERLCPAGQSCSVPGSAGTCQLKQAPGQVCDSNDDCETGFCRPTGGGMGVCDFPPPTPTPTKVPRGGSCSETGQCESFFVCNQIEGGVCCNLAECPAGQSCRVPGKEGFCQPIPPTPTPRLPLGATCSQGSQCESGFCVNNVCCEVQQCENPGDRCDITDFRGFCVPPFDVGESCQKNSDCITNLCLFHICQVPPKTPPPPCPGDCGGDGQVTIDELVTMVNIALGGKPVSECSVGDTSGDGEITIDEIIQAVNRALNGC
jgi:hypothetical protein